MSTTTLNPITEQDIDAFIEYLDSFGDEIECESSHRVTGKENCTHKVTHLTEFRCDHPRHGHPFSSGKTFRVCDVAAEHNAAVFFVLDCTCIVRPI